MRLVTSRSPVVSTASEDRRRPCSTSASSVSTRTPSRTPSRLKGIDLDVDELLALDERNRKLQHEVDEARRREKALSKGSPRPTRNGVPQLRAEARSSTSGWRRSGSTLEHTAARLYDLMLLTPQIPWDGAPVGADESANVGSRPGAARPSSTSRRSTTSSWPSGGTGPSSPGPGGSRGSGPTRSRVTSCCSSGRCTPTRWTCCGQGIHADLGTDAGARGTAGRRRDVPEGSRGDLRVAGRRHVPGGHCGGGAGRAARAARSSTQGGCRCCTPGSRRASGARSAAPAGTYEVCCGCTSSRRSSSSCSARPTPRCRRAGTPSCWPRRSRSCRTWAALRGGRVRHRRHGAWARSG